jgi:hypothetical protein
LHGIFCAPLNKPLEKQAAANTRRMEIFDVETSQLHLQYQLR